MSTVAVIGSGQMGCGIAQLAAQAGDAVLLWNRKPDSLEKGLCTVRRGFERLRKREVLSEEQQRACGERIRGVTALEDVKNADWVIEALPEDFTVKREVYERLGRLCQESAVFASNTSSLSISALAETSGRPQRFLGLHFFNPAPLMKLVEVVNGRETAPEILAAGVALAERFGKVPISVQDMPGFVVNRVVMPMINEAAHTLMQGVTDARSIDECMKLGCNHPMGPLALADLVGLDVVQAILKALHRELRSPHYEPCKLIADKVAAGQLGTKTGRGFYSY